MQNSNCLNCKNLLPTSKNEIIERLGFRQPRYCHLCSWQRKMTWENEYKVYNRKCDATNKQLISAFTESAPFPVYEREYWNSDNWEIPKLNYDSSKTFFEQYWELFKLVPRPHNQQVNSENSEYCNLMFNSSNCYLSFQAFRSEGLL